MTFADEIKNYTDDELDLIISTQKDLYSEEEMAQLQALQTERRRIKKEEHEAKVLSRLPETINCEKCDGPNPFSNNICCFCGHKLNKAKYYTDEYYEQTKEKENPSSGNRYAFHYAISWLIPLIGFIVGAIMLADDNQEKQSCGKWCIITGIISILFYAILAGILWF